MPAQRKVALVTGASSGIGLETIKRLQAAGVEVIAVTRDAEGFGRIVERRGLASAAVEVVEADLKQFPDAEEKINGAIERRAGRVDYVVNVAGVFHGGATLDTPVETFLDILNANLTSAFAVTRAALPHMMARRSGSVVNVASVLGLKSLPDSFCVAYGTAKAGLIHMTKLLAVELGPYNIRVNCVCPGILNPVIDEPDGTNFKKLEALKPYLPSQAIGRFGKASEIASAIMFLASEDSAWTTGAALVVDGGITL
jgi:NAD(P)-dependent dehydrogenase (short-subunit alcohol dehydrogenase family)